MGENGDIVGRSTREAAALMRHYFGELAQAREEGRPTCYVYVMGSFASLLRSFGILPVFSEVVALNTAVRKVAHEYIALAEDYGYSPDVCGYVKADVGLYFKDGDHPMGRIPRPSMAVITNACNTYIKWAEIWERFYRVPIMVIEMPDPYYPGEPYGGEPENEALYRRYVVDQVWELIRLCEKVSGRKFDEGRLQEHLYYENEMKRYYRRLMELNKSCPAPFDALSHGTAFLGIMNVLRGTKEGAEYFRRTVEEMEYKVAHGMGALPEEKFRLFMTGVPCYPIWRRFGEMFNEKGGNFVYCTYMAFASGGSDVDYDFDVERPVESMAEGIMREVRFGLTRLLAQPQYLHKVAQDYQVDGVVFHAIKSCRTITTGLAETRLVMTHELPQVVTLYLDSDHMDRRVVAEAQMKNRIDAFFEAMAVRKLAKAQ